MLMLLAATLAFAVPFQASDEACLDLAKKFKETSELLTSIEKNLGIEFKDLTTIDSYSEFVKSPEYADWMKSRNRK